MADRDAILEKNFPTPEGHPDTCMITSAMDEYMKESVLEAFEYVVKNTTGYEIYPDGRVRFRYKGEWITPEQLFENFL